MLTPHANQLPSPPDRLTLYVKQHNRQMLRVNVMLMGVTGSDVGGWLTRRLLFSSSLPSRQQLRWAKVWASSRRKTRWSRVQLLPGKHANLHWAWTVWAFLCATGTGFKIAHQRALKPFFFGYSLEVGWNLWDVFFSLCAGITFHFCRVVSLCVSLICLWKHMIYTQSSYWSLCVILIRHTGFGVCLRTLWVFIESADCRTAYCRTQTLFRGNAQSQQFPIPFLISSIPSWLMSIYHLTMRCCIAIWKWHVLGACIRLILMTYM